MSDAWDRVKAAEPMPGTVQDLRDKLTAAESRLAAMEVLLRELGLLDRFNASFVPSTSPGQPIPCKEPGCDRAAETGNKRCTVHKPPPPCGEGKYGDSTCTGCPRCRSTSPGQPTTCHHCLARGPGGVCTIHAPGPDRGPTIAEEVRGYYAQPDRGPCELCAKSASGWCTVHSPGSTWTGRATPEPFYDTWPNKGTCKACRGTRLIQRQDEDRTQEACPVCATPEPTQGTPCEPWCGTFNPGRGRYWQADDDKREWCSPMCMQFARPLNPKAPL